MATTPYTLLAWSLQCPPLDNDQDPRLIDAHEAVCGHWDAWVREGTRPSEEAIDPTLTALGHLAQSPDLRDDALYFYALTRFLHEDREGLALFSRDVQARPDSPHAADAYLWMGDTWALGCGGVEMAMASQ